MTTILIRGEGIAGSCCARLLHQAGLHVCIAKLNRPKLPAIMMGEIAQKLLTDVFETQDLFADLPRIRRRIVLWGTDSRPITLPHSAVVISEQVLLTRIQQRLECDESAQATPDWTVFASTAVQPSSVEYHFGSRIAAASAVQLRPDCDIEACWIESIENGWLFLLPGGGRSGWVLSVGDAVELLLERSRLIRGQLLEVHPAKGKFQCHPRIVQPLAECGWIACGTAAVGFDPLCGDGTGNAIREAILGSAVIRAANEDLNVDHLVAHYRARVLAGFARHLKLCLDFYTAGHCGPWWEDQLHELKRGLEWYAQQSAGVTGFHYRLNGFVLEPAD
jgi:flavin-dependent dehydrogenase